MHEPVRWIIYLQVGAALVISLLLWAFHDTASAVSAFAGGAIGFLTSWVYAREAYRVRHADPTVLLKAHFRGELYKMGLTILLFTVVFVFFKQYVRVIPLFLTYAATLAAYWVALLALR